MHATIVLNNLNVYTVSVINVTINVILLQASSHNILWEIPRSNRTLSDAADHIDIVDSSGLFRRMSGVYLEVN